MIIIVYNEDKTVTRILSCNSEEDIQKLGLEHYKIYNETNAYTGLNLDFIDKKGMIKSDKQLLKEGLVALAEDEIFDGGKIRKLTIQEKVNQGMIVLKDNEEIRGDVIVTLSDDEMKEKYPERYLEPEKPQEEGEKTILQAVIDKQSEIFSLKDQYLDADLDDNTELKSELKIQIQTARRELKVLEEEMNNE